MVARRIVVAGCGVALLWASGGCNRLLDRFRGQSPAQQVRRMESPSPDRRFEGINELARREFGRRPPYTERYTQIARTDADHLVRATAIRALNRARLTEATPIFVTALSDPNAKIRLEGAKALANIPDQAAIEPLTRILLDPTEDKDVRIAAADALRHYKSIQVARALAGRLLERPGDREFGVSWQARRSLRRMMGVDFQYDETAWLDYFVGPEKPFG